MDIKIPRNLAELPQTQIGSMLVKAINNPSNQPDIAQIWMYFPISSQFIIGTLEAIDQLIAQGWQEVPIPASMTPLYTQLHDTIYVQSPTTGKHTLWAHQDAIAYVEHYPVVLASEMEFDQEMIDKVSITLAGMPSIPMLTSLPLPSSGWGGFIVDLHNPNAKLAGYRITSLPYEAQQRFHRIGTLLREIASPYEHHWMLQTPTHRLVLDQVACQRELNSLFTRERLTQGKALLDVKMQIADLRQAMLDVRQVISMQQKPSYESDMKEVRQLMQDLARDYYEHHQSQPPQQKPPYIVDAFHDGQADMYYSLPFQAFSAASISRKAEKDENGEWKGGDWTQETGEKENDLILSFPYIKNSGASYVQIREDATGRIREQVLANMWEQSIKYSDLDSDVYLACLVQLIKGEKDEQGNTWITGQQILNYRGILPKKNSNDPDHHYTGGHRWEDLEKIAACMARQRNITIKIAEMEITDDSADGKKRKRGGKRTISRESPLFMAGDIIHHNTLPIDGPGRTVAIAWQYRESSWMLPFLEGPNRFQGKLIKQVLNYDPYHEQWEKRLSKYFMWYLRANARRPNKPAVYIGKLLQELNLELEEGRPQRNRDRFEKAMNRMQTDGLLTWSYKEETELRAKKWLPTWLTWQVAVDDAPELKDLHKSIESAARVIKAEEASKKATRGDRKKRRV